MARKRKAFAWRLGVLAIQVLGLVLLGSAALVGALRFVNPPVTAFMVQRQIEARRAGAEDFALRHRWVPLRRLPAEVGLAVISAEDQRFALHHGFDLHAIRHALGEHLQGAGLRGASTLSQQVAKNLFLWESRSLARKGLEAYFTLWIELLWPKWRILEVYLNVAELGDGVFGVGAAAEHHFGCDPRALSASQAAWLAAILPSPRHSDPRRPSPRLRRKQAWILEQMGILRGRQDLVGALRPARRRSTS